MELFGLNDVLTCKYNKSDKVDILYMDFMNGIQCFTKTTILHESIDGDKSKLMKLYLENVIRLSGQNERIFEVARNDTKWYSKISLASSFIAADGRIGLANVMLVSEKNYNSKKLSVLKGFTVKFIDDDDTIILYRKSEDTQPGLILVHSNDKYEFISLGLFPEKQFIKIDIK